MSGSGSGSGSGLVTSVLFMHKPPTSGAQRGVPGLTLCLRCPAGLASRGQHAGSVPGSLFVAKRCLAPLPSRPSGRGPASPRQSAVSNQRQPSAAANSIPTPRTSRAHRGVPGPPPYNATSCAHRGVPGTALCLRCPTGLHPRSAQSRCRAPPAVHRFGAAAQVTRQVAGAPSAVYGSCSDDGCDCDSIALPTSMSSSVASNRS